MRRTNRRTMDSNRSARIVNIGLGIWLFLTAFFWAHTDAQFTNTWLVGLGIAGIAAIAFAVPEIRWLNAILAAWLIISVWALNTEVTATFWNNLLVGVASLIVSVVPFSTVGKRTTGTRRAPPSAHPTRP